MEIKRKLAHLEKVRWVRNIPGADNIELIGILGWNLIAKKGEFKDGDWAVFFEIDSKLPETTWSEFMRSKHFKVKTLKFNKFNCYSQGLALPINVFKEKFDLEEGLDLTDILHVTYSCEEDINRKTNKIDPDAKYKSMAQRHKKLFSRPIVRKIMRYKFGRKIMFLFFGKKKDNPKEFPKWIVKTDETRIENAPFYLKSTDEWIKTEKLDGTSCTFAVDRIKKNKFEFIVCSRNVRQADRNQKTYHESNIYWELADKYDIENILTKFAIENGYDRVVLQGEGVGSVQGNPYKMKENELFVFNLIIDGVRLGTVDMAKFCAQNGLKHVPIIDTEYVLPKTMEEMKLEADGYSEINPKVKREGFVYRSVDGQQSFKNVSREYLLKHNG